MAIHYGAEQDAAPMDLLRRLVRGKGLQRFAFFFLTGEGRRLPNGHEVVSRTVVSESGDVYSFWTAWDDVRGEPTLTRWRQIEPDPSWLEDPEYRGALDELGLSP